MSKSRDSDNWLSEIDFSTVLRMFRDRGAHEVLYKVLPQNANSKNQVYVGSDWSQLSKVPSGEITSHTSTSRKSGVQKAVFRSKLDFYWLDRYGNPQPAPQAKLILYPQYPEIRFSGFLQGCKAAPTALWVKEKRGEEPGRILLVGVGDGSRIYGITLPPESPATKEVLDRVSLVVAESQADNGALRILPTNPARGTEDFNALIAELRQIYEQGWVSSKRLDKSGKLVPCNSSNCNGNTLEALLGIRSNGISLPDYRGWEVKARQVKDSDFPGSSTVTLFTPEPNDGLYAYAGAESFIRKYGYEDTLGREDRLNFGGIYRVNDAPHERTGLRMVLDGYDAVAGSFESDGSVRLIDGEGKLAAAWTFLKLMDHWKAKHAKAVFVPSQVREITEREYRYGRKVLLGEGAEFRLFLRAIHEGTVYYDPGIKLENASSGRPLVKKRSQFRIRSGDISGIYVSSKKFDVCGA
jgi:hypothetical protein